MDDFANVARIPAYAKRSTDSVWDLFVACPHCGDRHQHGGGSDGAPAYGPRLSHCLRADLAADYVLVAAPPDTTKPTAKTRAWRNRQLSDADAGRARR